MIQSRSRVSLHRDPAATEWAYLEQGALIETREAGLAHVSDLATLEPISN